MNDSVNNSHWYVQKATLKESIANTFTTYAPAGTSIKRVRAERGKSCKGMIIITTDAKAIVNDATGASALPFISEGLRIMRQQIGHNKRNYKMNYTLKVFCPIG